MLTNSLGPFVYGLNQLKDAAQWVIQSAGKETLWCFSGEMGSGKTTLIQEICKHLEVESQVSSPSFSLVNEYTCKTGKTIYHFDFYRIKSIEEVYDIGFEMYFDSGHICLIEWPEKMSEIMVKEEAVYFSIIPEAEQRKILRKATL